MRPQIKKSIPQLWWGPDTWVTKQHQATLTEGAHSIPYFLAKATGKNKNTRRRKMSAETPTKKSAAENEAKAEKTELEILRKQLAEQQAKNKELASELNKAKKEKANAFAKSVQEYKESIEKETYKRNFGHMVAMVFEGEMNISTLAQRTGQKESTPITVQNYLKQAVACLWAAGLLNEQKAREKGLIA